MAIVTDVEANLDVEDAVGVAIGALAQADHDLTMCDDEELVELSLRAEELGRLVDALRVSAAGEVSHRSRSELGDERLSARFGCRNAHELLERTTLASPATVSDRLRLARHTRSRRSLTGERLPAAFPEVAAAVDSGRLGADAADLITRTLARIAERAEPDGIVAAERSLVVAAIGGDPEASHPATAPCDDEAPRTGSTFAEVKIHAQVWSAWLDQDGPDPDRERTERCRRLYLGRERDGLTAIHGRLMPEVAARLRRLFDAHLDPARGVRFQSTAADDADPTQPWSAEEDARDPRSPLQKRHDLLSTILDAAAGAEDAPKIGGSSPTVLVSVTEDDLISGQGTAFLDGARAAVGVRVAERNVCAGGVQRVIFDREGRVVRLGSPERLFNHHQRRAIIARDGGCVIPGCTIPAGWCELHHVVEHARGGPTHVDNGVMLCWWHHHHLAESGWEIRMRGGAPEVRSPQWLDRRRPWRRAAGSVTRLYAQHMAALGPPTRRVTTSQAAEDAPRSREGAPPG